MDVKSGEFMEKAELALCRKIRVQGGETGTKLLERSRELIPEMR